MDIINVKVGDLIPYENNPRRNDEAVDKVALSISAFGFKVPIVIDRNNVVVTGHTRLKAAQKLGLTEVPCIRADDLTDEQIKAFRLADNKVAEFSSWDEEKLMQELEELGDIDMSLYGFEEMKKEIDWFEQRQRYNTDREEGNDEYNEFLDKFEIKKTTDDCYTPDNVYDAVASYVEERYGLSRSRFVRPFFPGGDYQKEEYKAGDVVVDNPPFSILAEIVDFYNEAGVPFFLFCQTMTSIAYCARHGVCVICVGASVTYENGAKVNTSFLTNIQKETHMVRTAPDLYRQIEEANKDNERRLHKLLPKYEFPAEVLTSAKCGYLSKYGQTFSVSKDDGVLIRKLDAMGQKGIYGGAVLLSEKAAAEKAAAEKAAAEKAAAEKAAIGVVDGTFRLSERERAIVASLGTDSERSD